MANLLNPHYYDNLDPDFYMYLYPELKHDHNIDTVEKAFEFYINNDTPYVPDRTSFLKDFSHTVYYHFYNCNILLDNYISDEVRNSIIDDKKRLSIIHYARRGHTSYQFNQINIDSNFNPYLYKIVHSVKEDLTDEDLFLNYLNRKESDEAIVVGNINELTYHIACNITLSVDNLVIDDTLTVKENLVVQKDAYILGNFGTDATGVFVEGGTITVNNEYSDMDRIFSFHRLSSNSLALGDTLIEANSDNTLGIDGGNVRIASNLMVDGSVLIGGDGLVYDPAYALQADKKIRVVGTDYLSDERVKTNIRSLSGSECLEKIKQIEIMEYDFKHVTASEASKVGVIAQRIKSVFPNIVSESYSFHPLIKETVVAKSNNVLEGLVSNHLSVNDIILLQDKTGKNHYSRIVDVHAEMTCFEVDREDLIVSEPYIIYGKEIQDSMAVDYTQLFCYMLCAFQETLK